MPPAPTALRRLLAGLGLLLPLAAAGIDLDNAREIHETCAGCHGKWGQGGKGGEYPRLAGQRARYIEEQLQAFRTRKRINFPMVPYTSERVLPDESIIDIAGYLASIRLTPRRPVFKDAADALRRREDLEKVLRVDRVEGDLTQGQGVYNAECAVCHGRDGRGRGNLPMLVGQYPRYLKKQIDAFRRGERPHDESEPGKGVLQPLADSDLQNILAHLTATLQDQEE